MSETKDVLRRVLSSNIKKRRKALGFSQEKLAEIAGISAKMVNDIEGCRTWVSDKTILKLSDALCTEAYQLLMPPDDAGGSASEVSAKDILAELKGILHKYQ
jgi:transcriptional regulator with XRE-family HTH domain